MTDYQITRTRKDGADADRRIDAVEFAGRVYLTDTVIAWIELGQHSFYTIVNGRRANVRVRRRGPYNPKYLTTAADDYTPNNLLLLPNC